MSETGLQKAEENQIVQMTKGDVQRLLTFAVEQVKEMTLGTTGSGKPGRSMAELQLWGGVVKEAGMIPAQKENGVQVSEKTLIARAIAKIVAGDQWGFDPFSSQSLLHFIPTSGTIVPDYKALSARILGSGKYTYEIIEHTNEIVTGQAYRIVDGKRIPKGEPMSYTLQQAKDAGLYSEARALGKADGTWPDGKPKIQKKGAWEAHTKDMLLSKLVRRMFNQHFADLYFLGVPMKTAEDYQEEAEPKQIEAAEPVEVSEADEPFFTSGPEPEVVEDVAESDPSVVGVLREQVKAAIESKGGYFELSRKTRDEIEKTPIDKCDDPARLEELFALVSK